MRTHLAQRRQDLNEGNLPVIEQLRLIPLFVSYIFPIYFSPFSSCVSSYLAFVVPEFTFHQVFPRFHLFHFLCDCCCCNLPVCLLLSPYIFFLSWTLNLVYAYTLSVYLSFLSPSCSVVLIAKCECVSVFLSVCVISACAFPFSSSFYILSSEPTQYFSLHLFPNSSSQIHVPRRPTY